MENQVLEQMLATVPRSGAEGMYTTLEELEGGIYQPTGYEMYNSFGPLRPAGSFGIGPGLARSLPGTGGLLERYRAGISENFGRDHVNVEYLIKLINGRTITLINEHIDMKK